MELSSERKSIFPSRAFFFQFVATPFLQELLFPTFIFFFLPHFLEDKLADSDPIKI